MAFNQFGEITREGNNEARKFTPLEEISFTFYYAIHGNSLPPNYPNPENFTYHKEHNIPSVLEKLQKIENLAKENNISEFETQEKNKITINDAIQKIKNNIEFSQKVNSELKLNPELDKPKFSEEELKEKRKKLLDKLRGNK